MLSQDNLYTQIIWWNRDVNIDIHLLHTKLTFVLQNNSSECQQDELGEIVWKISSLKRPDSTMYVKPRLYSKVWPMLSIFDSNKQKTPLEISVVFDRWGAVL
jgi:hypothetical protein